MSTETVVSRDTTMRRSRLGSVVGRVTSLAAYLLLLIWALGQLAPLAYMVLNSFKTDSQIALQPLALPDKLHFENFKSMFLGGGAYPGMAPYLVNSTIVVSLSLAILMSSATMAAYAFARYDFPGRALLYRGVLLTLAVPVHAMLIPVFVLMGTLGLRNSSIGIALLYAAFWMPLTVVVLRAYFESFPREIEDSARIDGCSEWNVFFRIVAPMSRGSIASMAIVNFVGIWSELLFAFVILNKSGTQTVTAGLLAYIGEYSIQYSLLFAALTAAAAPTILFFLVFQRHITKGMTMGAFQ